MKRHTEILLAALLLAHIPGTVLADDDVEGRIQVIYWADASFVVRGIEFFVTESTEYDDGLRHFGDLRVGQKVEVEFEYYDGIHYAEEIELDD